MSHGSALDRIKISPGENGATKVRQVVDAISQAIGRGDYQRGSALPSVNQLSAKFGLSRDTVFKAYSELKRRGVVDSTPTKGYRVKENNRKVFVFLDSYSAFKEVLYNSFVDGLGKGYQVDLAFHHYNYRVFEAAISDSIGRYSAYVIMNFSNGPICEVVRKIDLSKLLILDWGDHRNERCACVCQDFEDGPLGCLREATPLLRKYRCFVYYNPPDARHPKETIKAFRKYCAEAGLQARVLGVLHPKDFMPGSAFLVTQQKDLVTVLRMARKKGLHIGEEVGVVSYNDSPLYEVIENGITSISTDFAEMGRRAAQFVKTRKITQEVIPTRLIVRGSL